MMNIQPRPYAGPDDLNRMKVLAQAGQKVLPHSGYPHIGDLNWWLFYGSRLETLSDIIRLWEDEHGEIIGWQMFDKFNGEYDSAIHPSLRGSDYEAQMIDWAENWVGPRLKTENEPIITFASADDEARIALMDGRGYKGDDALVIFNYNLEGNLPTPKLPEGYRFLEAMHAEYAEKRADVHFNSFNPSRMTSERYTMLMEAPDYNPALDVVVVAPDETFSAFAMCWVDQVTDSGIFEPVGTRKSEQRKGLGKAALWEGLRRMQQCGVHEAHVLTWASDEGNIAFYQAAGFTLVNRIRRYQKQLNETESR